MDSTAGNFQIRLVNKDSEQIGSTRDIQIDAYRKLTINSQEFFLDQEYMVLLDPDTISDETSSSGRRKPQKPNKRAQSTSLSYPVIEGYVEISSDGALFVGSSTYRGYNNQNFIATLLFVPDLQGNAVFNLVASNDLYFTNIAIANLWNSDASITLDLYNNESILVDTTTFSVPSRQQLCHSLDEYFSVLQVTGQNEGYVMLSSSIPVGASLTSGTNNLSVLSSLPVRKIE